jgi:hypothetical protein
MNEDDVESPPYPSEISTADVLFNLLKEVRRWTMAQREALNRELGQELIPKVAPFPKDKTAYLSQPVLTQFRHFLFLRRLREGWDHVLRMFEGEWSAPQCIRHRAVLIQHAAVTLNDAFVSPEVREMRAQEAQEELQRAFDRLIKGVFNLMEPEGRDPTSFSEN